MTDAVKFDNFKEM